MIQGAKILNNLQSTLTSFDRPFIEVNGLIVGQFLNNYFN